MLLMKGSLESAQLLEDNPTCLLMYQQKPSISTHFFGVWSFPALEIRQEVWSKVLRKIIYEKLWPKETAANEIKGNGHI